MLHPQAICPTLYQPAAALAPLSRAATALKRQIDGLRAGAEDRTVLVGTGDNFAINYLSRVFHLTGGLPDPCGEGAQDPRFVPKDQMVYLRSRQGWVELRCFRKIDQASVFREDLVSGRSEIDADNVARFLAEQKYLALVPGKHDFHFGPERLRQVARLMAKERGPDLLGANLVVQSKPHQPSAPRPESRDEILRRTHFTKADLEEVEYTPREDDPEWSPPKTPLPWLRSLRLKKAFNETRSEWRVNEFSLCEFSLIGPADGRNCRSDFTVKRDGGDGLLVLKPGSKLLAGEVSYLACATVVSGYEQAGLNCKRLCTRLDIHSPYFQYPEIAPSGVLGGQLPISDEAKEEATHRQMLYADASKEPTFQHGGGRPPWVPRPYVKDPTRKVVVMGAVLQGLESLAGALNTNWTNTARNVDTRIAAVDPADSLTQMLDYCVREGHCTQDDTLILLAQMPRDAAQALNAKLSHPIQKTKRPFHLVIAAADVRYADEAGATVYKAGHPPPVLVPNEMFAEKRERISLNVATLTREEGLPRVETGFGWKEELKPADELNNGTCWTTIQKAVSNTFDKHTGTGPSGMTERFPLFVLKSMRDHLRADVALMQRRDLYFRSKTWDSLCPAASLADDRTLLELVLWKGDFAVTRTVTGADLKAALAESKKLKEVEDNPYDLEVEGARDLLWFGLYKKTAGKETTWYVNGLPIDDKAPYSVAMTDFLAFGDTGYPTLAKPAAGDPERARDMGQAFRIVELANAAVDRFVIGTKPKAAPAAGATTSRLPKPKWVQPLAFETYADPSSHQAFTQPSAAGFGSLYRQQNRQSLAPTPNLASAIGQAGQMRTYFRLLVDKGEIGGSRYAHNQPPETGAVFGDTTESGVNAFRKFALTGALHLEPRLEFPRWHPFARLEMDLGIDRTQQKDGLFLKNYPANNGTLETGVRVALNGPMRSRPWVGLLASVVWNRQVLKPRVTYTVPVQLGIPIAGCPEPEGAEKDPACMPMDISFPARLEKTTRFNQKLGLRAEASASWIEAGLFRGEVTRPFSFQVAFPGGFRGQPCLVSHLGVNQQGEPNMRINDCLRSRMPLRIQLPIRASEAREQLFLVNRPGTRPEQGAFVNFNLRHRLPKGIRFQEFTAEGRTRLYFVRLRDDVLSDPRLASRLQLGLTLPLFGAVSLKPTYTLLHYLNKVNYDLLRGGTTELKLEYRFDYRTGAAVRRTLLYGRPK